MSRKVVPLVPRRPAADPESLLHDMRGSLSAIRGQSHAIARLGGPPDELMKRLRLIDGEVERILGFIDRLRAGLRGVVHDEPRVTVDVLDIVRSTVRRYDGVAGEAGVSLRVHGTAERSRVAGSAEELRRAVDNLVANAIHHAPHGSLVTLTVDKDGDDVIIGIADRGPGLPMAGDGRPCAAIAVRSDGWGMGLAIVGDIVARHDGRIGIGAFSDDGACVRVALPADPRDRQVGS